MKNKIPAFLICILIVETVLGDNDGDTRRVLEVMRDCMEIIRL